MIVPILLALLFLHSAVSRRLERTVVTAPFAFTAAGIALGLGFPSLEGGATPAIFRRLAELGLVLLLFTDASRTRLRVLEGLGALPVRLLGPGLLLTLACGALAAQAILPQLSLAEAGILAAILAPTDAGLGQVVVTSPRLPVRIRQALNVEAGLNDGLCVPFLLFFVALAGAASGSASLTRFIGEQLGRATIVGAAIGLGGGWILGRAHRARWSRSEAEPIGVVALPLLALLASEHLGTSMFIASFVAGLAVQVGFPRAGEHSVEFAEQWGQVLNLSVFLLFGLTVAGSTGIWTPRILLYALASLTVVRMLPVAIALAGAGLSRWSALFVGWFGPRGLASIVLGLVYLEQERHLPGESVIRSAVIATVLLSVAAHGLSAQPGIAHYARRIASLDTDAPERRDPSA